MNLHQNINYSVLFMQVTYSVMDNATAGYIIHNVSVFDIDGDIVTFTMETTFGGPFTIDKYGEYANFYNW